MKLTHRTLAVLCAAVTLPAQAGDFTSLLYGTGPGTDLKWGTADDTNAVGAGPDRILGTADDTTAKVSGAGNVLGDKLYLKVPDARAATATTPAYKPILYSSENSKVPLAIDYFATEWRSQAGVPARGTHTAQGTLTLVDSHVTFGASLGGVAIGDVYDFVFRDSRDNTLVFGTRVELGQKPTYDQDAELNFLYRYGFVEGSTVFKTDIAWTFLGNTDLRLYNAARADLRSLIGTPTLNLNAVSFQSDINLSEGNPFSGLYLIRAFRIRTVPRRSGADRCGRAPSPARLSQFLPKRQSRGQHETESACLLTAAGPVGPVRPRLRLPAGDRPAAHHRQQQSGGRSALPGLRLESGGQRLHPCSPPHQLGHL